MDAFTFMYKEMRSEKNFVVMLLLDHCGPRFVLSQWWSTDDVLGVLARVKETVWVLFLLTTVGKKLEEVKRLGFPFLSSW